MNVAVSGGGAAGFFAAISSKTHHPKANVTIYERTGKLLSKVKVSGGGRCNVTNACLPLDGSEDKGFSITALSKNYPRGEKQLRKSFPVFSVADTVNWFESRGVKLKTEPDNRMFPVTNNSQTIIDCLMHEAQRLGIIIKLNCAILSVEKNETGFLLGFDGGRYEHADKVIIATGGSPKPESFDWLAKLNHRIEPPVPSLFTFNIPDNPIRQLMGVSVEQAAVKIQGTKLKQQGPLLITHWGLSGPAVLKLSAFGARVLHQMNYHFKISVNWCGAANEETIRQRIADHINPKAMLKNQQALFKIPSRLWLFLLGKCSIDAALRWPDLSKDKQNKLIATLTSDEYTVQGKTTFREEFVTCGGVSAKDVNFETMQSNACAGMYFAGEVLDVDGITGGFNFQAAWTTGFIAGMLKE